MKIKSIERSELSSVIFIRDYIQFVFEGEKGNVILSAFSLPSTEVENKKYDDKTSAWRDALCTLINKVVSTAIAVEENAIIITFEDGAVLEISLKEADKSGTEAAILSNDDGRIMVW